MPPNVPEIVGKTKELTPFESEGLTGFRMVNTDSITIGDGRRHWSIAGKGVLATAITSNVFKLLDDAEVPTHYLELWSPDTILIRRAKMYKVEVVVRHSAEGSYLKRNPDVVRGTVFDQPIVEMFFKDDKIGDPYMFFNEERGVIELHEAKKPLGTAYMRDLTTDDLDISAEDFQEMVKIAQRAFKVVRDAFLALGYDIPDGKLEFGRLADGRIVLCDVYDCESFRMRNSEGNEISKQVLRDWDDAKIEITQEMLNQVLANYAEIAAASSRLELQKAA